MTWEIVVWIVLTVPLVGFELYNALAGTGYTISELDWKLSAHWWWRMASVAGFAVLLTHLFLNGRWF